MKILTVRQPWAWAMFNAGKDVENRTRRTKHRGPLAIHVSTFHKWHEIEQDLCVCGLRNKSVVLPGKVDLEQTLGCIVGVVDLVDCVRDSASQWARPGGLHWVIANPRRARPVPIVGQLGIFERDIELEYL